MSSASFSGHASSLYTGTGNQWENRSHPPLLLHRPQPPTGLTNRPHPPLSPLSADTPPACMRARKIIGRRSRVTLFLHSTMRGMKKVSNQASLSTRVSTASTPRVLNCSRWSHPSQTAVAREVEADEQRLIQRTCFQPARGDGARIEGS